jgi:KDO2-lipid IV(A) lauroyltransferase
MPHRIRDNLVYHLLRAVLGVGSRLPLSVTRSLTSVVSRLALRFMKRERQRMRDNIAIAFPELDERQQSRIMAGCADHLGRVLAEIAWLWRATEADVLSVCEIEGAEHLQTAVDEGQGGIVATGHLGNWEMLNAYLSAAGFPITVAVRELDDPRVDELVTRLRSRFGSAGVPRGTTAGRRLLRAIGEGRGVGLLIDQDIPSIPGVFVPFFGRLAWTPSGAAMLALRGRCPVLPGFIHRKPDGTHKIKIYPSLPVPSKGPARERVNEMTAAITAAVEWQVRAWPEQWVWMHRRWRTRPDSEAEGGVAEIVDAGSAVDPDPDSDPVSGTETEMDAVAEAVSDRDR